MEGLSAGLMGYWSRYLVVANTRKSVRRSTQQPNTWPVIKERENEIPGTVESAVENKHNTLPENGSTLL